MSYFCQNAQEAALKEIAIQMKVRNEFELLQELRRHDAISEEVYLKKLRELYKVTHD